MKRTVGLIAVLILSMQVFAQNNYDYKLLAKFDKSYLEKQVVENQIFIERQNFIVNNSYKILDASEIGNTTQIEDLKPFDYKKKTFVEREITNEDILDFNIFKYYALPGKKSDKYYKIGNTGKILVVFSVQKQAKLFNNYRKNN